MELVVDEVDEVVGVEGVEGVEEGLLEVPLEDVVVEEPPEDVEEVVLEELLELQPLGKQIQRPGSKALQGNGQSLPVKVQVQELFWQIKPEVH